MDETQRPGLPCLYRNLRLAFPQFEHDHLQLIGRGLANPVVATNQIVVRVARNAVIASGRRRPLALLARLDDTLADGLPYGTAVSASGLEKQTVGNLGTALQADSTRIRNPCRPTALVGAQNLLTRAGPRPVGIGLASEQGGGYLRIQQ
jgi:hypothetical protein